MTEHENAPALLEQGAGRGCLPGQADTPSIPEQDNARHHRRSRGAVFRIAPGGREPRAVTLTGRAAWSLRLLIEAGAEGLTSADVPPGVRLAALVHKLRAAGVPVKARVETHGGPFAGWHSRYGLAAPVEEVTP